MDLLDPARIRQAWTEPLILAATLESTSTTAFEHCRSGAALPLLVVAHQQTAGRGQLDRSWWSGPGSLTFSLALPWSAANHPAKWLTFAAAVAIAETIEAAKPTSPVRLKWPNDLLLDGKKVGGILCETLATPTAAVVVGIGLNVQRPPTPPPPLVAPHIGWLADALPGPLDATSFFLELLGRLRRGWPTLDPQRLVAAFRQRCVLTGQAVRAHGTAYGELAGICRGINDRGELVIESATGAQFAVASARLEWPLGSAADR